jgi:hypothetical protein
VRSFADLHFAYNRFCGGINEVHGICAAPEFAPAANAPSKMSSRGDLFSVIILAVKSSFAEKCE